MNNSHSDRDIFMSRLRSGLKGLPRDFIDDTIAEYEAHFESGIAAGRSERDIATSLGDPSRLARELRAEAGVRQWEDKRSLESALRAIFGIIGLATLDLLVVLPVLLFVGIMVIAVIIASAAICLAGCIMLPFALLGADVLNADWLQNVLISLSLASGGLSATTFSLLFVIGIINLLIQYGRAHYRLIAPPHAVGKETLA
ncbi:MAG: DUF1700 domain-containing protein [Acetobacter sp.]|jgi:uncharacterized membrane protein|nr:DUF1700 domain-containing protein [Acetobacter sp.]MCH4060939.1 DUF1700 domain-containing protein [Acetobacter sp.]MCH4087879.1 DUF1700 domain-containing protein [Acetobacter sp.]MCI1293505.1 DUF1700 domain-containing protein [Acetobacter sp.]MCI1319789.1 DUF1700 domain-containing protein [Acetobacter sp.]